jgi:hypothetical protein
MSQSGLNVELGMGYNNAHGDLIHAMSPVLSVAKVPLNDLVEQVHWVSHWRKQMTLSIPCLSAQKDCGLWPSTGPEPWASLRPFLRQRDHP